MRAYASLSTLILIASLCGACTSTVEELNASQQPNEFGRSACTGCLTQACSEELTACGREPSCAAYWNCIQGCPVGFKGDADAACEAECTLGRPLVSNPAKAAGADLLRCRNQDAGTYCAACGKVAAGRGSHDPLLNQECSGSSETNACYRCEAERCCQSYAQYKKNPEAVSLVACSKECLDENVLLSCLNDCLKTPGSDLGKCQGQCAVKSAQCQADCRRSHQGGVQDSSTRLLCVTARCGVECNNGNPLDPCVACTFEHCIDAIVSCGKSPECNLLQLCTETCLQTGQGYPSGCPQDCLKMAPAEAQRLLLEYQLCSVHSCPPSAEQRFNEFFPSNRMVQP